MKRDLWINSGDNTFFCHQVVGMEEGESDYSVVHLGPETQGLPAFHRIVGEDEVSGISLSSFDILIFSTAGSLVALTV